MGLGVLCFTIGGAESVKPLIELYKKEIERAEPVGDFVNDNVMVTTQLLCLEDGARVRRIATDMGMGYHRSLLLRYLDTFPRPAGIPEWPQLLPDPTREQIDAAIVDGATPYGTPDEVTRAISKYEDAGADQVVFGLLSSTLDRELACETIETFGRHVLPQFDTDPVHRTTRLRENAAGARRFEQVVSVGEPPRDDPQHRDRHLRIGVEESHEVVAPDGKAANGGRGADAPGVDEPVDEQRQLADELPGPHTNAAPPGSSTFTVPSRTTKSPAPSSPGWTRTCPAGSCTSVASCETCHSPTSSRPENIGMVRSDSARSRSRSAIEAQHRRPSPVETGG